MDAFIQGQANRLGPDQQGPDQQGPCERSLKREDHFDTAGATGPNSTTFAASFLCKKINFCWHQHSRQVTGVASLSWVEFKDFLRKILGEFPALVDTI